MFKNVPCALSLAISYPSYSTVTMLIEKYTCPLTNCGYLMFDNVPLLCRFASSWDICSVKRGCAVCKVFPAVTCHEQ